MKVYNRLFVMLLLPAVVLLAGCKDDEAKESKESVQLGKLSDTWVVDEVTMDGGDVTDEYSSFELTISGSANSAVFTYGVMGRPLLSPWPSGGTWSFGADVITDIVRDPGTADEMSMTYQVTDTQLTIEFTFNGSGYNAPGRLNSAAGEWVYIFTRK